MSRRRRNVRHQRGIWLVELMAMMVVVAAVLLITGEIVTSSSRAAADARRLDAIVTKVDQMIMVLRKDVWESAAMHTATDAQGNVTLELEAGDGRSTRWQLLVPVGPVPETAPEVFTVTRTSAGGVVREWHGLPQMTASISGPLVTLEVVGAWRHATPGTGSRAEAAERMTLVSQRQLAGGAK